MEFEDGSTEPAIDTILYATGYVYDFPFLGPESQVRSVDNRCGLLTGTPLPACEPLVPGAQACLASWPAQGRRADAGLPRVNPLYKHLLVPHWAPTLSLLGLPFKVRLALP